MEVAVYHPWLKQKGGAEKVVLEYAKRSEHAVSIFTRFYDEGKTFEGFRNLDVNVVGMNAPPKNFLDQGVRFGLGSFLVKLPLDRYDAFLVSETGVGSLITLRNHETPTFCYCHTPLRAALPEFRDRYLREQSRPFRPIYRTALELYDVLEKRSWGAFERVFVNSRTTEGRILEKGIVGRDRISVLHPGADIEENRPGKSRNYFLYPSRFRRYKRQDLAVKAFREADVEGFELVLAGSSQETEYVEELRAMIGGEDDVRIETDVTDERWKQLYRHCYSVVFLAEKEDWGIVPVEAASHGKPCIAANAGGPSESVIHGRTGLLVEPTIEKVASAMGRLAGDRKRASDMGERARTEAKKYSWDGFTMELDHGITDV